MKKVKVNPSLMLTATLALWGLALLTLAGQSREISEDFTLAILAALLLIAFVMPLATAYVLMTRDLKKELKNEKHTNSNLAKLLGILIICSVSISTLTAIRSFWFNPISDDFGDRFIYENVATGFGFAGIALTLILASLRRNVFLIARNKDSYLDERQSQARRMVYETSYKTSVFIVLAVVWWVSGTIHNIPTIIANSHDSVPGHLYWLPINLMTTLVALPFIIVRL